MSRNKKGKAVMTAILTAAALEACNLGEKVSGTIQLEFVEQVILEPLVERAEGEREDDR